MNPAVGIQAFVEGFSVVRHPALRHYVWLPVLLSFLVCGTGLYFTLGYLTDTSRGWIEGLPDWLSWLDVLLVPLIYLIGILAGAWLFGLIAVLLASPFLGALSLALERERYGNAPQTDTSLWSDLTTTIGREGRKILYHLPRLLGVFILTLIPVINLAAPAIWLLFGAWTLAVQFADYPTENRQQPFQDTLTRLKGNRGASLAFGACATGALAIPFLNFLLIPVAVAGGTLLWHDLEATPGSNAP
ncbi:MAG: sulfate transporter CysZ [Pseudomonadota bacterium]